jgi:hypothetical protein
MVRPKKEFLKDHITVTIDRCYSNAIKRYQEDPKNLNSVREPTRSKIIQSALLLYLKEYFQTETDK